MPSFTETFCSTDRQEGRYFCAQAAIVQTLLVTTPQARDLKRCAVTGVLARVWICGNVYQDYCKCSKRLLTSSMK